MALVAWYKLNGNVLDSTVNGNHGTIVGSPTVVNDGPFGSCYLFNPDNNDRISINNLSQFIYNTPFTFSAWIKTSGLGTGQTVNGIVSLTYGTRFCGNSAGNIYIHFLSTSIGSYSITSSGININDNMWHHVCVTYDGDILKLYIDGVLNNSSVTGIVQTNTYTNNGAIGLDVGDPSKYKFNGSISDVRIYDEALSLKEIKELSKAKVLHYDFNQYQEPTTNLLYDNETINWTISNLTATVARTTIVENQRYKIKSGASAGTFRLSVPLSKLTNGLTYNLSFKYKINTGTAFNMTDWCDMSLFNVVNIDYSEYKYSSACGVKATYDSTYRFMDFYISSVSEVEIWDIQLEAKDHATPFVNGTRTAEVYDKSGYNNNAELALSTTPTYINESIVNKGCYEFDGTQYMTPDSSIMNILIKNSFTISFWLYSNDVSGIIADVFGGGSYGNTQGGVAFSHYTSNGWCQDMYLVTSGRKAMTLSASIIPYNQWNHIIIIRDRNNLCNKMYVNGSLVNTLSNVPDEDIYWNKTTFKLKIGKGHYAGTQGKLADFRIYSTALSEDDIKEIYQTRASIDENGNLYCGNINNGYMIWDSEINSINLITNGSAELENNTNFTSFNYITTDSYDGTGCLSRTGYGVLYSNEYIKIDKYNGSYYLSGYFKSAGSSGLNSRLYFGIACFDYLKRLINADMVCHYTNTETTLAQPLNNGDTIVYLTSANNWHTSASVSYTRRLGVYYNEIDIYPKYTYTRSTVYYTEADLINNTITLTTAWSGGTIPSGTYVANHYDTNDYQYIAAGYASVPFTWTKYISSNAVSGWSINNPYSYFRYGTEYIKLLFLSNYGQDSTYTTLMDNLKFWNTKAENKVVNINIEKTSNIVATKFSEVGITEGLVAYYPLNGDAKDYSGNNNHGTIYGAIKAGGIAGKKCFKFDGTDDYIQLPNSIGYITSFTATAWFKSLGTPAGGYHIIFGGSELEISIPATGALRIGLYTTSRYVNNYGSGLTDGNWHHVCMTFNGTKKIGYIDGNIVGETNVTGTLNYSFNRTIGKFGNSTVYYTNGKIQDVRIYNRALSDKEIGILYNIYSPNINKSLQINTDGIIYTKGNLKEV